MAASNELHLVLKGHWYDLIAANIKNVEYREIGEYWNKRLTNFMKRNSYRKYVHRCQAYVICCLDEPVYVVFHRGYTNETIRRQLDVIYTGYGNPLWGAKPGKEYICIQFRKEPSIGQQFAPHRVYPEGEKQRVLRQVLEECQQGSPLYDILYNLYLDLKWEGCPLPQFNPKGL